MKRLKITNEQYDRIILHEQKSRILMEAEQKGLNHSNEVLLGIAKLMGLDVKGYNEKAADKALTKSEVMKSIKDSLESETKRKELIDDLKSKGFTDSNILYKADTIAKNFNKYSKENKLGYTMDDFSLVKKILKDK
jgi:hypothetical protein